MGDHVFICYSRKDEDFVLKLASNLKNRGIPIWLDQWDIPSGANWNRTIEKALEESTRLLVILSPSSVASDEVQCEWLPAIDAKKVVIPIIYQPCQIPRQLKLIQYIDFTSSRPDDERTIGQILKTLGMTGSTLIKPIAQPEQPPERLLNKSILDSPKANNIPDNTKPTEYKAKTGKPVTNIRIYGVIAVVAILSLALYFNYDYIHDYLFGYPQSSEGTQTPETPVTTVTSVPPVKVDLALISPVPKNDQDVWPEWIDKGNNLSRQGKYNEAIQAYDKAIELSPQALSYGWSPGNAWFLKGYALYQSGKYDEAIQDFDKSIEIDPVGGDSATWDLRGLALFVQGKYDEAIQDFDKSIEIHPEYEDVWYYKGLALSAQGKYDEAIQAYDKSIELKYCVLSHYDAEAWYNKGLALKSLGHTTEANAALAKSKELGYTG